MTKTQIEDYLKAYEEQDFFKDWGYEWRQGPSGPFRVAPWRCDVKQKRQGAGRKAQDRRAGRKAQEK